MYGILGINIVSVVLSMSSTCRQSWPLCSLLAHREMLAWPRCSVLRSCGQKPESDAGPVARVCHSDDPWLTFALWPYRATVATKFWWPYLNGKVHGWDGNTRQEKGKLEDKGQNMKLQLYNALVPNLKTFLNYKEKLLSKRFSDLNTVCTVFGLQASWSMRFTVLPWHREGKDKEISLRKNMTTSLRVKENYR